MGPVPGVDYSPKRGGVCPNCGREKASVSTTRAWNGEARIRYHKRQECSQTFKTIEVDYTLASKF